MILKIIWVACSLIVFKRAITYCIKGEMDTFGEIDSGLVFIYGLLALTISLLGPLAILGYFLYNVLEDITRAINERYTK